MSADLHFEQLKYVCNSNVAMHEWHIGRNRANNQAKV